MHSETAILWFQVRGGRMLDEDTDRKKTLVVGMDVASGMGIGCGM